MINSLKNLRLSSSLVAVALFLFCALPQAQPSTILPERQRAEIEASVMEVLDAFMATFNRMDIPAWESTFQFPHYRYASGSMNVLNGPSGRSGEAVKNAIGAEWHHSAWSRREIIHLSATKVHVDTRFARYREDNSLISSFDSLYILTKEDGRWGIKLRSSMAP